MCVCEREKREREREVNAIAKEDREKGSFKKTVKKLLLNLIIRKGRVSKLSGRREQFSMFRARLVHSV